MKERVDESVDELLYELNDEPMRHLHVPAWKRRFTDPPVYESPEDKEIDLDAVYADPGSILLDNFGVVER